MALIGSLLSMGNRFSEVSGVLSTVTGRSLRLEPSTILPGSPCSECLTNGVTYPADLLPALPGFSQCDRQEQTRFLAACVLSGSDWKSWRSEAVLYINDHSLPKYGMWSSRETVLATPYILRVIFFAFLYFWEISF